MAALGLFYFAGVAVAQPRNLVVPPDLQLTIMIRTTLVAYNHANQTGNYSVLRDLGSPSFQKTNTQARLAEIFRDERARNVDISAVVLLPPKLLQPAAIDAQGRLVLAGLFDSEPEQVKFTLGFEAVDGIWRLYAIGVKTGQAAITPDVIPQLPAKNGTAKQQKSDERKSKSR
ncbi:MAG: hypothetical protein APF80_16540 [Alphaproteobacteria bacterium BRH_c36]|nr:MAG: hypothetical protein APF80_16540 [Alphaproteobacteria bacterium BRH_c36]